MEVTHPARLRRERFRVLGALLVFVWLIGCPAAPDPSAPDLEPRAPERLRPPPGAPRGPPVPSPTTLRVSVQRFTGPDAGEPALDADSVEQVRIDGEGNLVVVMRVRTSGAPGRPWTVAKLDRTGARIWTKTYPDAQYQFRDLALSPLGSVYLCFAPVNDGVASGPGSLMKLSPEGTERWVRTLADGAWGGPLSVDVDGNVLVVEQREGGGSESNRLIAYDWEGSLLWSRRLGPYGSAAQLWVRHAAYGTDGSFAATATVFGVLELAGVTLGAVGEATPIVLRATRNGDPVWVRAGLGSFLPTEVAVLDDGAIAVTGVLASGVGRWGAAERTNPQAAPFEHTFLGWLDADGIFGPVRILGSEPRSHYLPRVAVHPAGNALVAQRRGGFADEGLPSESRCAESDVWSISAADALRWHRVLGDADCSIGARSVDARGVAGSPYGDTWVVGQYRGEVSFGMGPLPSVGADGFGLRWWRE